VSPSEKLVQQISPFVPSEAADIVVRWIIDHKIQLTITEKRISLLGDYRWPDGSRGHRISINGDLNRYAFLVTFVHEMAHLTVWQKYFNHVATHGKEWKNEFRELMDEFTGRRIFPGDIRSALKKYLVDPSSTHCDDPKLMKVLNKYNREPTLHLEDLPRNALFEWSNGRVFKKGEKLRKRYKCYDLKTQRIYLFSAVAEVKKIIS
jgi:hypothetical protein